MQKQLDQFYIKATQKWFEWLGWLLIIGAVTYVEDKEPSIYIKIIQIISYILLFFYFQSYFYQFTFINIPLTKGRPNLARALSLLMSGVFGLAFYLLIFLSIGELKS